MGLGKLWRTAATVVTLASAQTVAFDGGTQATYYIHPSAARGSQGQRGTRYSNPHISRVELGGGFDETTRPGPPIRAIAVSLQDDAPHYDFVAAGDKYGSLLVVRREVSPTVAAIDDVSFGDDSDEAVNGSTQLVLERIRSLSGLSWPRIAKLIGVERQTLFRWRSGASADRQKAENARTVLEILLVAAEERSLPHDLRAWLNRRDPFYRDSPLNLIEAGKYEEAHFLAMLTPTSVTTLSERGRNVSRWEKHILETEHTYVD